LVQALLRVKKSQEMPSFVNPVTLKMPLPALFRPMPLINGIPYTLYKLYSLNNLKLPIFTSEEKNNLIAFFKYRLNNNMNNARQVYNFPN
jgi:hypothetical protein